MTTTTTTTTAKRKRKSWEEYNVAWIAALPIERSSATEMLDEVHDDPEDFIRNATDDNSYTWGRMHEHNIVVTSLPSHSYGKVNAAHTVVELLASLPHIKFGLLVGIGAGLPSEQHDIRLGDVVVSQPDGSDGGVIQYDLGKAMADGTWERVGSLNAPPIILLRALSRLQAEHESGRFLMEDYLSKAMERNKYWGARFCYPAGKEDHLFRSRTFATDQSIEAHTVNEEVKRAPRTSIAPHIHYGMIASGDILVKNARFRDDILEKIGRTCICIEMEAAGLMQKFPCIVVRGISDYSDRHKNDDWQRYASATAAAFAKELLFYTPAVEVSQSRNAADIMDIKKAVTVLEDNMARTEKQKEEREKKQHEKEQKEFRAQKVSEFLRALYTCPYTDRKDRNVKALDGTCQWLIQHPRFLNWLHEPTAKLLWLSADPGCGKSVLAKHLIDNILNVDQDKTVCYFFFKDDFADQNRCTFAMNAILRQLFIQKTDSLSNHTLENYASDGRAYTESFDSLWKDFVKAISRDPSHSVICVFDALDECHKHDGRMLIKAITEWHQQNPMTNLKFLITSRPYLYIKDEFYSLLAHYPTIHLSGESEEEAAQISKEIDIVIRHRIRMLCQKRSLNARGEACLVDGFMKIPHRTYLWAHLTMEIVESIPMLTTASIKNVLANLPNSVEEAYEKILNRSLDFQKTRLLLHLLLAAQRPLSVAEMNLAMSLTADQVDSKEFDDVIESVEGFRYSVRDLCGLFVVVLDYHVYLLHQTAREFLLRKSMPAVPKRVIDQEHPEWADSFDLSQSHRVLAERCLWYLFTSGASSYNPLFFEYCEVFWVMHFTKAHFETNSQQVNLALYIFRAWSNNYRKLTSTVLSFHNLRGYLGADDPIPTIIFPAWFGCISVIRKMLDTQLYLGGNVEDMHKAFWFAAEAGHTNIVELFALLGLSVNTQPSGLGPRCFGSPLWCATTNNDKSMMKLLLKLNADFGSDDGEMDHTLLHIPSGGGYLSGLKPFIGSNHSLPVWCDSETIELLIQNGADPASRMSNGTTPLHTFLEHRQGLCSDPADSLKILKLLLIPGTDINKSCRITGGTLLKFAALSGCTVCMDLLKNLGASTDLRDSFGNTILHDVASSRGDPSCIRFILRLGMAIDCRNSVGQTPLMVAARHGRFSLVKEFLLFDADVSAYDVAGRTPLMFAMMENPANFDFRNNIQAITPWSVTYLHRDLDPHGQTDIVGLLLERGADLNAKDIDGRSCIHRVMKNSDWSEVEKRLEKILQAGADVNSIDNHGQTALRLAFVQYDNYDRQAFLRNAIEMLLRYGAEPKPLSDHVFARSPLFCLELTEHGYY